MEDHNDREGVDFIGEQKDRREKTTLLTLPGNLENVAEGGNVTCRLYRDVGFLQITCKLL